MIRFITLIIEYYLQKLKFNIGFFSYPTGRFSRPSNDSHKLYKSRAELENVLCHGGINERG